MWEVENSALNIKDWMIYLTVFVVALTLCLIGLAVVAFLVIGWFAIIAPCVSPIIIFYFVKLWNAHKKHMCKINDLKDAIRLQ